MNQEIPTVKILEISKNVLRRLSKMDCLKNDICESEERLIFPSKHQAKGEVQRISEQELRFLFVEEFKITHCDLFYSIETPTNEKYILGKSQNEFRTGVGRSASHDMCIYKRNANKYRQILNIEFKHSSGENNTTKDIFKLVCEKQDGVFIHVLKNTNSATLNSIFEKLKNSFNKFKENWKNGNSIELVILSIAEKQKKLIYCKINKLSHLEDVFKIEKGYGNISKFKGSEGIWEHWNCIDTDENCEEISALAEHIR